MARKKACGKPVGHYVCPNPVHKSPTYAIIREKANEARTRYGFCGGSETEFGCGMWDCNLVTGQEFFNQHGTWWPYASPGDPRTTPCVPPDFLPAWIRENRAMAPKPTRSAEPEQTQPVDTAPAGTDVPAAESTEVTQEPPKNPPPVPDPVPVSPPVPPAPPAVSRQPWEWWK